MNELNFFAAAVFCGHVKDFYKNSKAIGNRP